VLVTVLAITVVIAVLAVYGLMQARIARNRVDMHMRDATALRLITDAESILAKQRSGSVVRGFQELLVSCARNSFT
jgi:Tfp pilus assembly protein PilX